MKAQHYLSISLQKAKSDLIAETRRGYLGLLWWFIEPILYMSVFYFVFVTLFNRGGEMGVISLLTALVVWKWFASGISHCANSIEANAGLIRQIYLPKFILPFMALLSDTFKFFIVFIMLILFMIFFGYAPKVAWLLLPFVICIQFIVILSIGALLSAIVPFLPNIKIIIENALTLLLFLSGIFFSLNDVPIDWQPILQLNPMLGLIDAYRTILIQGVFPDIINLIKIFTASCLLLIFSVWFLNKNDRTYAKLI